MLLKLLKQYILCCLSICALIGLLLLTSCDTSATPTTATKSGTPTATSKPVIASAVLKHVPAGEAFLAWDQNSQELQGKLVVTGLVPKSTHPADIRGGSCNHEGAVVYQLDNLVADEHGDVNVISTLKDVAGGIPVDGWYIAIHNGPQLSPDDQFQTIACGNIANAKASALESQSVHVMLGNVPTPDQSVGGIVQLSVVQKTLAVTISMNNLAPNSSHSAHLYSGSCNNQGTLLNDLQPVVASDLGNGTSTTTIPHITTIPSTGWYIIINLTNDSSTDIISCGDIATGALG